ncbi:MAG: sigma-54-dependent Fis family transcriptional regulator, partial [Hyphomicrobiaceae bacterium]
MTDLPLVLVIDDELRSVEALERILEEDFRIRKAVSIREAEAILEEEIVQVVLCDQRMPEMTGVDFLKGVRTRWPDVVRMIISGYTDAQDIIAGINDAGIYQYVTKPWQPESLILSLRNAVRLYELQHENGLLTVELKMSASRGEKIIAGRRRELQAHYKCDDGIVRGPNSPMDEVCARLQRVAPYDVSVLVTGESGTGKELVARALHYNSLRWNKPFVVENCAAMPDELLESELFGHKRGAFTGAIEDHISLFERANGGTVFLDEIGEVSPKVQVELLRVLEEKLVTRLGGTAPVAVDFRTICATNRDLQQAVREGNFREDLFWRLNVVQIHIPPLRERPEDVPVLAEHFLARFAQSMSRRPMRFAPEAMDALRAYAWPGNVRELQNAIERAVVVGRGELVRAADLPLRVTQTPAAGQAPGSLAEAERADVLAVLEANAWNITRAARVLDVDRVTLYN